MFYFLIDEYKSGWPFLIEPVHEYPWHEVTVYAHIPYICYMCSIYKHCLLLWVTLSLWSKQCYLDMLIGYQIGYQVIVFYGTTYPT